MSFIAGMVLGQAMGDADAEDNCKAMIEDAHHKGYITEIKYDVHHVTVEHMATDMKIGLGLSIFSITIVVFIVGLITGIIVSSK